MRNAAVEKSPLQRRAGLRQLRVAIAGNPNAGKTTVFNALTGMKQKIGNFPGVTVERKSGMMTGPENEKYEIIDLPGLYSLVPRSLDEKIAVDILTGDSPLEGKPDIVVVIADATNLARCLYLSTQIFDLGYPVILVLNMMDLAHKSGLEIDVAGLSRRLGLPVVAAAAKKHEGIQKLKEMIFAAAREHVEQCESVTAHLVIDLAQSCRLLVHWLLAQGVRTEAGAFAEALRILSHPEVARKWEQKGDQVEFSRAIGEAARALQEKGIPAKQAEVRIRYAAIDQICAQSVRRLRKEQITTSEKIDRVLTHKFFGPFIMLLILATVFQSIYTWAEIPMNAIDSLIGWASASIETLLPPGPLQNLLVDGVIAGVGAVLVFLPQIGFLFFFLAILEDTGYLARVAFIMDRFMARIGLSGQSVIPLLSSFACAIPGIMATRTIQNSRDRLLTMLVAPFMSCSARLPVYTLLIGAFFPDIWFGGIFYLPGLIFLAMYLLGITLAIFAAAVLQKWVVSGQPTSFIMELPLYRTPVWRFVLIRVYDATKIFVMNAGKIILAVSIVLWFLASYPKVSAAPGAASAVTPVPVMGRQILATPAANAAAVNQLRNSYAGRIGRFIEPVIRPLGFDWKIGIGLITSFAAREVIISTLATIYNLQDADESSGDLRHAIRSDVDPATGKPVFTPLIALSLMVFFVIACQCMSTLAVVRRETGSWRWPAFMFTYMFILAYLCSFAVFQVGSLLGFA